MNGIERKRHAVHCGPFHEAGLDQCVHITVDRFHIATDAPSDLTDGEWLSTSHGLEYFPPLGREDSPKQFGRGKANSGALPLAAESPDCPTRDPFTGGNIQYNSFHVCPKP